MEIAPCKKPRSPFLILWGEGEREMLVKGEFAYHSVKQVRLMKPVSTKFE